MQNSQVVLVNRPPPGPIQDDTFRVQQASVPDPKDGELVVRVEYASVDPTMRGWINDTRSYLPPVEIGAVMRAGAIGRVVKTCSDKYKEGDLVFGMLGWQDYWVGPADKVDKREVPPGGQVYDHLGVLGMSGMTAYFGMTDIGRVKDGDTVVVSGAAGSVGLIACQIALAKPACKVVAIAGSSDKCEHLKSLGCHVVLNYKDADFGKQLKSVGLIDVYFDNVGGEVLDRVLAQLKDFARVVLCGAISVYNTDKPYRLVNTPSLISTKSSMTGFIVMQFASRYAEGAKYLTQLKQDNKLQYDYHIVEGGANACVGALKDMFEGSNRGKTIVKFTTDHSSKL